MKYLYFLLLLFGLLLQSCNEDDLEATVPAYIKIDRITVNVPDSNRFQGTASSKITDAWVYINDQLIGAFELPTLVPVLRTGNVNIAISAGIFNNGLSNQRKIYPFYADYEVNTDLIPEQIIDSFPDKSGTLRDHPIVEYQPGAVFDDAWSGENFDNDNDPGINFLNNPLSDTIIVRVDDPALYFEGDASGGIFLRPGTSFAEFYTPTFSSFEIPTNGTPVYMEFNYRCTHDFNVSVYTDNRSRQFSVVNFRANAEWNKAYVDFSNVFSPLFNSLNFNIAIGLRKPTNENAELYFDNFKLINF